MKKYTHILIALALMVQGYLLTAQIQTYNFTCNCEVTIMLPDSPIVLCGNEPIAIEAEVDNPSGITPEYQWYKDGVEQDGTSSSLSDVSETGTYTLYATDENDCTTSASVEVISPEDFFKDGCFIEVDISSHTLTPIGGLSGQISQSRSRMEELTVTFTETNEQGETIDISLNISGIPNNENNASVLVSDSDNCSSLSDNIRSYQEGGQILAHVDAGKGKLYLGSSADDNNESGQQVVDQYLALWEETTGFHILSAPINYSCAGQFSESNAFNDWWDLFKLFTNCNEKGFELKEGGIIPKCLWECYIPYASFTGLDPATMGMVDGIAGLAKETIDLVEGSLEVGALLSKYFICNQVGLSADYYENLEEDTGISKDQLLMNINSLADRVVGIDCEDVHKELKDVGNQVNQVVNAIANLTYEQIEGGLSQAKEALTAYMDEITDCTDLKSCNNAAYEVGGLVTEFASLFFTGGAAMIPYLSKILQGGKKVIDNLLDFIRDMFKFPDLLDKDTKKLISEDPELIDTWNYFRKKYSCPNGVGNITNSRSSAPCKYDELLKALYKDPGIAQRKRLLRQLKKDDKYSPGLYEALADDKDLLEPYRTLWRVANRKQWVRTNTNLLKRVKEKNLTEEQTEKLAELYKSLRMDVTRKGNPPTLAEKTLDLPNVSPFGRPTKVEYDEFGFPKFEKFVPDPKSNYAFGESDYPNELSKLKGNGIEFQHANNKVAGKFGCQIDKPCKNDKFDWDGSSPNFSVKYGDEWVQYTWHHHQDGKTMIPIPSVINNPNLGGFSHTGGNSIIDKGLTGFFDGPKLND